MKRQFTIAITAVVTLIVCVFLFKYAKQKIIEMFVAKALPTTVLVTVDSAKQAYWEPQIHTVGSVKAKQSVDIAPEVSGRVTAISFKSGQKVEAGMMLVQLNPDVLSAQLLSAKAKLNFQKKTYKRQLELLKQNAGQQQAVDSAKANMDEVQATVDQIQAQLDQLTIKAPFNGMLGLRYVNIGQYVSPGNVMVNLQSINPMEVDFTVPEVMLNRIAVGLPVTLHSLAYPNEEFKGEIYAVNSQIDVTSRALAVRASVENKDALLVPDMFVEIAVHLKGGKDVVVIPQIAVNYSQIGNYVYLAKDGKAVKQYVTLGERRGDLVSVEKGLSNGQGIVTAGQLKLFDGASIEAQAKSTGDGADKEKKEAA